MEFSTSDLGCSVAVISDMRYPFYGDNFSDVREKGKLEALRQVLLKRGGGLAMWVDIPLGQGEPDRIASEEQWNFSGKELFDMLRGAGYDVQRSRTYINPNTESRCTAYMWYFTKEARKNKRGIRAKASSRSVSSSRRSKSRKEVRTT